MRHLPPDMWEVDIQQFIHDRLGLSAAVPCNVTIVRGARQLKLQKRGIHKGEATVDFATGGDNKPAAELATRAIEELHGANLGQVRLGQLREAFITLLPLTACTAALRHTAKEAEC